MARILFWVMLSLLLPSVTARAVLACVSNAECDDGNPCSDDLCDSDLGCLHANNSQACTDGNACTTNDVCRGGRCVGGDRAAGCAACSAVAELPPQGGTFYGSTSGQSDLAGTCSASSGTSPERVYRWVPISSGTATFETCSSTETTFNTVLYLRSGSCAGSQLKCSNNVSGCSTRAGAGTGSRISASVTAGQPYYVVVDGHNGGRGTFRLKVTSPSRCGNNLREGGEACDGTDNAGCATRLCKSTCTCVAPGEGLPDLKPELGDVRLELNTSVAAGDVAEGCAETSNGVDLLRFSTTSRNIGSADFVLGQPRCPSPCTAHPLEVCGNPEFVCSPAQGHNHAHYNNYARYELLDALGQSLVVGHKQGFCLRDSQCANPKFDCSNQGMTKGCSDVYGSNLGCQYLDVTDVPNGSYRLRVRVDPFNRIPEGSEANNVAELPVTINRAVANCASVTSVPASGGTFTGSTSGTSVHAGSCGQSGASPERVFKWKPSRSGTATIETCGSGTKYDTVLYVRTGCGGSEKACNDDACINSTGRNLASRIRRSVTAGTTYYIFVDGYDGAKGSFRLKVTPP